MGYRTSEIASRQDIAELEYKLGVALPSSYKNYLLGSDYIGPNKSNRYISYIDDYADQYSSFYIYDQKSQTARSYSIACIYKFHSEKEFDKDRNEFPLTGSNQIDYSSWNLYTRQFNLASWPTNLYGIEFLPIGYTTCNSLILLQISDMKVFINKNCDRSEFIYIAESFNDFLNGLTEDDETTDEMTKEQLPDIDMIKPENRIKYLKDCAFKLLIQQSIAQDDYQISLYK